MTNHQYPYILAHCTYD